VFTAILAFGAVAVAPAAARTGGGGRSPFAEPSVRRYLAHRRGNVTAAVYDVRTGVSYVYRPTVHERTASIVKVDILATLLHEAQARGGWLSPGEAALAQPMIEVSDNDAADALWSMAGGADAIGPFDRGIGMSHTAPNANGHFGLTWTTAPDQIQLLRQVMLPGDVLSRRARRYEYELMRHVTSSQRWGVSAGVPHDATVALKNGWLPVQAGWQVNSIGSIRGSGRDYLVAVLTDDDPSWDYGIATIQRLSAATWRALGRGTTGAVLTTDRGRRRAPGRWDRRRR
jgi:beta-lactamase class A